jgi:hypothetical protein
MMSQEMSIPGSVSTGSKGEAHPNRELRWLVLAFVACFAGHLVQMFTPLRMTTDSVEYLSVAASAADGKGCLFDGKPTQHPCGYAFMISVLDRTGIARSWSLVGLNVLRRYAGQKQP